MGHIINPVLYRISKSKFWFSSWNNITYVIYKLLFFEDLFIEKIFNWLRSFKGLRALNIFISTIKITKFYKKFIINIFLGALSPFIKKGNFAKVEATFLFKNFYRRVIKNYRKRKLFKSYLGRFLKRNIKRWKYKFYFLKWDLRFILSLEKRFNLQKNLYRNNKLRFKYTYSLFNPFKYNVNNNTIKEKKFNNLKKKKKKKGMKYSFNIKNFVLKKKKKLDSFGKKRGERKIKCSLNIKNSVSKKKKKLIYKNNKKIRNFEREKKIIFLNKYKHCKSLPLKIFKKKKILKAKSFKNLMAITYDNFKKKKKKIEYIYMSPYFRRFDNEEPFKKKIKNKIPKFFKRKERNKNKLREHILDLRKCGIKAEKFTFLRLLKLGRRKRSLIRKSFIMNNLYHSFISSKFKEKKKYFSNKSRTRNSINYYERCETIFSLRYKHMLKNSYYFNSFNKNVNSNLFNLNINILSYIVKKEFNINNINSLLNNLNNIKFYSQFNIFNSIISNKNNKRKITNFLKFFNYVYVREKFFWKRQKIFFYYFKRYSNLVNFIKKKKNRLLSYLSSYQKKFRKFKISIKRDRKFKIRFFFRIIVKNLFIYLLNKLLAINLKKNNKIIFNLYNYKHKVLDLTAFGLKRVILARVASDYRISHVLNIIKNILYESNVKNFYKEGYKKKKKIIKRIFGIHSNNLISYYNNFNLKKLKEEEKKKKKKDLRLWLRAKKKVIGLDIKAVGRYRKKLRNKRIHVTFGKVKPSNINTPISYVNFIIIYKFGVCGIKISLIRKHGIYEII